MKRFLTIILALCLMLPMPVRAADSGSWGENMSWQFEDETLTIRGSGDGKMADFAQSSDAPWYGYKEQIKHLVLIDVVYIGARAFTDFDVLEDIDFGSQLYEVGEQAFKGCDGLADLTMPATFKVFGPESFRGCKNLKTITCLGRFPSFRLNCLWDVYVKILYPKENSHLWPKATIAELENTFKGRIEFLTTDGEDPNPPAPPETTPPVTTPVPTPANTTPQTTPTVTAPPQESTAPVTTPAETTPETTPRPTYIPEPEEIVESEPPEDKSTAGWLGAAIILAILSTGGLIAASVSLYNNNRRKKQRRRR